MSTKDVVLPVTFDQLVEATSEPRPAGAVAIPRVALESALADDVALWRTRAERAQRDVAALRADVARLTAVVEAARAYRDACDALDAVRAPDSSRHGYVPEHRYAAESACHAASLALFAALRAMEAG